jgi:hypothetical protein
MSRISFQFPAHLAEQVRAQWWLTFYEMSEGCSIPEFRDLYGKAVDQLIAQFELPISEIRNRQQVYKQLLGI